MVTTLDCWLVLASKGDNVKNIITYYNNNGDLKTETIIINRDLQRDEIAKLFDVPKRLILSIEVY